MFRAECYSMVCCELGVGVFVLFALLGLTLCLTPCVYLPHKAKTCQAPYESGMTHGGRQESG